MGSILRIKDNNTKQWINVSAVVGPKGDQGEQGIQGVQGIQGEKGDPFRVAKIFTSVSDMQAGFDSDGVAIGDLVIITTETVEDDDNAKLFIKGNTQYEFVTDMSGALGIQGPIGLQGVQGPIGPKGDKGDKGDTGATGPAGADGKTPVRGIDYWTESDKAEIKAYIDEAIQLIMRSNM